MFTNPLKNVWVNMFYLKWNLHIFKIHLALNSFYCKTCLSILWTVFRYFRLCSCPNYLLQIFWHLKSKAISNVCSSRHCSSSSSWNVGTFMNYFDMSFYSTISSKWLVANQTSEWFLFVMNCFDMVIQISFLSIWLIANQTCEWFLIAMNCFHMPIQITFSSKWFVANQTCEWFLIPMNGFDMCI